MSKPNSEQDGKTATGDDLRQVLGDMDDQTAATILALQPSMAQVEEVRIWLDGGGDVLGKEQRPLDGVVAQIYDMLAVEEEEPSR
jgi:hypothetical protein